jgi:hypothetical protein
MKRLPKDDNLQTLASWIKKGAEELEKGSG